MYQSEIQFCIQTHVLVCSNCRGIYFCKQLEAMLRLAAHNSSQQDNNNNNNEDDYYWCTEHDDWNYWYTEYDAAESWQDYEDVSDKWQDYDYLAYVEEHLAAADCLNFEHYAPKGRIHADKHIKKDKRFYLKKKFAHLPAHKRAMKIDPLVSLKRIYQYMAMNPVEPLR